MGTVLVCSNPIHGHVGPMLGVARHLAEVGHRVLVLTGSRFEERARAAGAEFRALPGVADFDDRDQDAYLPDRARYRGLARAQYDIQSIFVRPIPDQLRGVKAVLDAEQIDAILVDGAFAGVGPLLFGDAPRPPILALGVMPLAQSSRDVAPTGTGLPPSSTPVGRIRNRMLQTLATRVLFRDTQRLGERIFADAGVRLDHFVMDISSAYDRFLQLSAPKFEYPRSDLAPNTAFVGPVPSGASGIPVPPWWADLDGTRPVVHVTQGTIDNHDLDRLIRPTVTALADLDVTVVVSLGGRDPSELGDVPANARVAAYLPYDLLLPRTAVVVTNGGFGGVQEALRAGVPLVVAGDTEDKPEVAARVGWSGAGVNLRTGTPTAAAVRDAVTRVLSEERYQGAAKRQAEAIARLDTFALLDRELEAAIAAGPRRLA